MRAYLPTTRRDRAEIVNQRGLNVAGRTYDLIPPSSGAGVPAKRGQIKAYMNQPVATRLRPLKKGGFRKKEPKRNTLRRVHLIIQARRRRRGLKGLYGAKMRTAAAGLSRHAQVSVGFLKSIFLPIIRGLNPLVRFKFPFAKTSNISRWPNSAGHGIATPAIPGPNCTVTLRMGVRMKLGDNAKAIGIVESNLQRAVHAEAAELNRHVRDKMAQRARQAGWRSAA